MSWPTVSFSDVAEDVTGGNLKTLQSDFLATGQFPIVDQGKGLIAGFTDDEKRLCRISGPVIVFGDHTKAMKYIDFPFCLGADGTKILQPKSGVDPRYLFHALHQIHIPEAGYSRHFKYLKEGRIPLPLLPEQRRIAGILDQVDALRRLRRQSLSRLSALGQAIFYEMFGGLRSNPFAFPMSRLGDIAEVKLGKMLDKGKTNGHAMRPYLRNANVRWFGFDLSDIAEMEIPEKDVNRFSVQNGDLLICEGGEPGRCAIWQGEDSAIFYQKALHRARVDETKIMAQFLNYWFFLANIEGLLVDSVTSATIAHLTSEKIKELRIALPTIKKQQEFVARLSAVDVNRQHAQSAFDTLSILFVSLQNRAFREEL